MREAVAQALGAVLRFASSKDEHRVYMLLGELARQAQWEVRQGGFLGLHALLAIRVDVATTLVPTLVPLGVHGYLPLPSRNWAS